MWGRHLLPPQRTPIRGGRREECRWGILRFLFKRFFSLEHFTFLWRTYHWKKPFLFPEIPETATTKASCSQSTHFFCTFLVPHLGQTVKGKKYWITRLIFWQGQKFSRILISPIHLPLQSSNNNERKIQPTHIKNILTWYLNHHLDPGELVSAVSGEKSFWTAPHMSDITGGAWLDGYEGSLRIHFFSPIHLLSQSGLSTQRKLYSQLPSLGPSCLESADYDTQQQLRPVHRKRARCRIGHFQLWSPLPWPLWALELVTCLLKPLHPPHQKKV